MPTIYWTNKERSLIVWDKACKQEFDNINKYLMNPPILMAPVSKKPFLVYVWAMDHTLGAWLAKNNE